MINKNITRTAAIVYSETDSVIKSSTIQRKIIESLFVENDNTELTINQMIDELKSSLEMDFDINEIEVIINDERHANFQVRYDTTKKENYIKLEQKRVELLSEREKQNSIFPHIERFKLEIYEGDLSTDRIDEVLHNYFYQLLNSNISAFRKIAKPKHEELQKLLIEINQFEISEREAINEFLGWEDYSKNKSIFALISYSIEYAVITNNQKSSSMFLQSIKHKVFF